MERPWLCLAIDMTCSRAGDRWRVDVENAMRRATDGLFPIPTTSLG